MKITTNIPMPTVSVRDGLMPKEICQEVSRLEKLAKAASDFLPPHPLPSRLGWTCLGRDNFALGSFLCTPLRPDQALPVPSPSVYFDPRAFQRTRHMQAKVSITEGSLFMQLRKLTVKHLA